MSNEDVQCPVCGYYCLGKGGVGCIDKPSMVTPDPPPVSPDPWQDIDDREEYLGGTWYLTRDYVDAARAADALKIADLTAQERKRRDALLSGEACEAYRNVQTPCKSCGGWGVVTYGSTATWRGGIGGQAMTPGVCDRCWGSGDEHRRWPSWRETDHLRAKLSTAEATIQQQAERLKKLDELEADPTIWMPVTEHRQAMAAAEAALQKASEAHIGALEIGQQWQATALEQERRAEAAEATIHHLRESYGKVGGAPGSPNSTAGGAPGSTSPP